MNADEKIMTLKNRALKLKERMMFKMQDIKDNEALYQIRSTWQDKIGTAMQGMYPSDDNMSNFSGYSSGPDI